MTSVKPSYFPKAQPLNTITLGAIHFHVNLGETWNIQFTTAIGFQCFPSHYQKAAKRCSIQYCMITFFLCFCYKTDKSLDYMDDE